jgi:hypothetical protein
MDPRAGVDLCEKSRPHRDSIPEPSSQLVAIPTELPGPQVITYFNSIHNGRNSVFCYVVITS